MSTALSLEPVLDLSAAQRLKTQLTEHRGEDLRIDAGQVQRLGGLCLQILLAAHRAWTEDGHAFGVAPRSEAFASTLRLFGAAERLGSDMPEGNVA
ncbi:MAG: anti-sigma factor antagonist [Proteobacteria bacterium]|nr:anti-sigma factor antagonist [Pseudomonadota bacterium]